MSHDAHSHPAWANTNEAHAIPGLRERGEAFANAGYTAYPSLSYAFETFSIPDSVPAPLPSAANGGVVLLGVVGALALARRRRAVPAL